MSEIRLLHGDCLDIMPTLPAQSAAMCFADLPYRSKTYHSTDCKWDIALDLNKFWKFLHRLVSDESACVFTGAQPFTTDLIMSNRKFFRYCLVWDKVFAGNFVQAKKMPMRHHEDLVVFSRKMSTYNPQMIKRPTPFLNKQRQMKSLSAGIYKPKGVFCKKYTHAYPRSILIFSKRNPRKDHFHPTQKPVALLEWLINSYTNEGDTVLDPCAGSGTTAIAAMRTGRKAICIEKDAKYYDIMCKRVEDERRQGRLAI